MEKTKYKKYNVEQKKDGGEWVISYAILAISFAQAKEKFTGQIRKRLSRSKDNISHFHDAYFPDKIIPVWFKGNGYYNDGGDMILLDSDNNVELWEQDVHLFRVVDNNKSE